MRSNPSEIPKKNSVTHASTRSPYSDERINWLRSKVESSLYVEFEQSKLPPTVVSRPMGVQVDIPFSPDCFLDCLTRDENRNLQLLMDYLQDTGESNMSGLVFWFESVSNKLDVKVNLPVEQEVVERLSVSENARTNSSHTDDSMNDLSNKHGNSLSSSIEGGQKSLTESASILPQPTSRPLTNAPADLHQGKSEKELLKSLSQGIHDCLSKK